MRLYNWIAPVGLLQLKKKFAGKYLDKLESILGYFEDCPDLPYLPNWKTFSKLNNYL